MRWWWVLLGENTYKQKFYASCLPKQTASVCSFVQLNGENEVGRLQRASLIFFCHVSIRLFTPSFMQLWFFLLVWLLCNLIEDSVSLELQLGHCIMTSMHESSCYSSSTHLVLKFYHHWPSSLSNQTGLACLIHQPSLVSNTELNESFLNSVFFFFSLKYLSGFWLPCYKNSPIYRDIQFRVCLRSTINLFILTHVPTTETWNNDCGAVRTANNINCTLVLWLLTLISG